MKILFVCHGNSCRSPMAHILLEHRLKEMGLADRFAVDSAGISGEDEGNSTNPHTIWTLQKHGIWSYGKTARQITREDLSADLILVMDHYNQAGLFRMYPDFPAGKVRLLLSFCGEDRDIADPWFTHEYDTTWNDINAGVSALIDFLRKENADDTFAE